MRAAGPPLAALALTAALTACGGGDGKSGFVSRADAACGPGNATVAAVAKPGRAADVATGAGTAATAIDAQAASLRAIKAPDGAGPIVAAIAEVSAPTKALQEAAGRNDEAAMAKAATEVQAKAEAAGAQAQAYGLTQCGTGLKPALANVFDGTKATLKASYVAEGEALCRESLRKSDALPQPTESLPSIARFVDRYLPIYTKFVADFKALVTPPGDEATVQEILGEFDAALPKIREIAAAAKAGNTRLTGTLFTDLDVDGTRIDAKLDAYGLKACGSAGGF